MANTVRLPYSNTATNAPSSLGNGVLAINQADGKIYYRSSAGVVTMLPTGGASGVVEAATASAFPATGAAATIYIDRSTNRLYRWASEGAYAEIGSLDSDSSNWTLLVPGTPSGVSGTAGNAQVVLSWTAPTYTAAAITDYAVQYSSNSGSTWTTWSHTASTSTTQTVTGLANSTAYIFRVAAVSGLGTGSYSSNSASITPVSDPNFSSVSLLLHFDGSSGATTFTDSSGTPKTLTSVSGAQLSSTQSKFGGTSLYLNGSGYVTIPYSSDLDLPGDFTVEWWQYWTSGNSIFCWSSDFRYGILANYAGATSDKLALCLSSTGSSWNMAQPDTVNSTFAGSSTGGTKNAWQHIAVQRSGNTFQMFFDGTRVLNYTASGTLASASGLTFRLGGPWPGAGPSNFTGYIDEFRMTKGVARYTTSGNFTAPTTAFPNQ